MQTEYSPADRHVVSVVLATYNEFNHIEECLDSLRAQETRDFDLEILTVDGMSTDGTREYLEKVAAVDSRVRVLANLKRRAPFAFNIGIREAKGSYICIFGSHTTYAKDYISTCFRELHEKDAGGCGGRVYIAPASGKLQARLVAYAFAHPFGSSRKSFRTQPEGYADTIGYMILRREALNLAGGYSETLLRNQDNDTNQKIRQLGYKLYCTWKTHCFYRTKDSLGELFRYAYRNGFWNVISFKENSSSMGLRHFIPFFFLLALISTFLLGAVGTFLRLHPAAVFAAPFLGLLLLHLGLGTLAGMQTALRKKDFGALFLPFVFLGFHIAYGGGTLIAFLTGAISPESSPTISGTTRAAHPAE